MYYFGKIHIMSYIPRIAYLDLKCKLDASSAVLIRLKESIDPRLGSLPASLNIITGTGITHTRKDGVNVIALAALGY